MKPILIIGEAWGEHEERQRKAFVGPSGHILNGLLAQAGIEREACVFSNVFNLRPPGNQIKALCTREKRYALPGYPPLERGHWLHADYAPHIGKLFHLIDQHKPNIILALGNTPLWALTKLTGIGRWRGSPVMSINGVKVLATWHPAAILRQWELRPIAFMDICKAKREAESPLLRRPKRIIHLEPTLDDLEEFYERYIDPVPLLAADIETKGGTITEVGFAPSVDRALVVPFWHRKRGNYWPTLEEERQAWAFVARVFALKKVVGQNFQYDMNYLWRTMGIPTPGFAGDTMLLHHSLQPEMKKGLGFLGSIYTDEPSWKFMRTDHATLKREDD